MSSRDRVDDLVRDLRSGAISRREFVGRAGALGLSLSAIGLALSACRGSERSEAGEQDVGELERELAIYNWSDYIADDTIPNFEKEFGVRVTYDTYESNEEMLAKLQAGAAAYDLVVPSNYVVPVLVAQGLAFPLVRKYLTNFDNLSPAFANPVFDPDSRFSVAYQWGTTGIAYRRDRVSAPPASWSIFHDLTYRGKMTQMDDHRDVIGAWLRYRGHSLNSTDPGELAQARADAIAAKQNLKAYISAPVKAQLISGDVWIAQLWNGDTFQAKQEQPALDYVLPGEGSTIWTDSLLIPTSAPHKRAAHAFIDYVLRPEVGAAISSFTGYGTPNQAAMSRMANPIPYPTAEELRRLEYQKDLGEASELWDRIWTEIKSA